ncbi:MAG: HAMP domain-containing sensor histidine kinase [Longicatena sp.]
MSKQRHFIRLSIRFILVVIISGLLAASLFSFLFCNRYRIFYAFYSEETLGKNTNDEVLKLQDNITKKHISKNDSKAIRNEIRKYKNLTMYLYETEDEVKNTEPNGYIEDKVYYGSLQDKAYIGSSSFLLTLYEPNMEQYNLKFYDGNYELLVYSYQGAIFMERFLIVISTICILLFLSLIMLFVHRKMKYVLVMEKEMKLIEHGDYQHAITYQGNDELTALARQLNRLRNTLYDNVNSEEEARIANKELVTTMSHDLRTPLTSLLGYLNILTMKIYKNEEDKEGYITKSKQKAEQIKELSDKLFQHFLVNSKDEQIELRQITSTEINLLIEAECEDLRDSKYEVHKTLDVSEYQIKGEYNLLTRVFDNLFSNIKKYADKDLVIINEQVIDDIVIIKIMNKKKKISNHEESTQIGLKSVFKLMKKMEGSVSVDSNKDSFIVELTFKREEAVY